MYDLEDGRVGVSNVVLEAPGAATMPSLSGTCQSARAAASNPSIAPASGSAVQASWGSGPTG